MQQIHLRIPDHILDMIGKVVEGKTLTDKVNHYICSNYLSRDFLELELENCKSKIKFIERMLQKNPFHNRDILSKQEIDFFTETVKIKDKKGPEFVYGRRTLYNNKFGKDIQLNDFKLLLYEFKEEMEKKKK